MNAEVCSAAKLEHKGTGVLPLWCLTVELQQLVAASYYIAASDNVSTDLLWVAASLSLLNPLFKPVCIKLRSLHHCLSFNIKT